MAINLDSYRILVRDIWKLYIGTYVLSTNADVLIGHYILLVHNKTKASVGCYHMHPDVGGLLDKFAIT